jgi:Tfp pilus assembly protein PilN
MRPVNLLPEGYRPRSAAQRTHRGHLVIVGLGLLLVGMLAYVLTANQATSRRADAVRARAEAQVAQARAKELTPFGEFAKLKQTREASVKQLAAGRFDWERTMRELARVLPEEAWVTQVKATTAAASTSSAGSSQPSGSGATPSPGAPTLELTGCARSQPVVATTLVRLRRLTGTQDVELADSAKSASDAASSSTPASGGGDCGRGFAFNATVTLDSSTEGSRSAASAPASLGGGS